MEGATLAKALPAVPEPRFYIPATGRLLGRGARSSTTTRSSSSIVMAMSALLPEARTDCFIATLGSCRISSCS